MSEKIKKVLIFRYSILFTFLTVFLVFIILKIKNQIIDYFLFFAYFIVIFFLLDLFRKKTDILILNEVKKDKAIPKSKLEVDNLAEWTEQTNREIAQLKANEQFRKEFIGDVAHELKTPIFNIQGFVSTLLDGAINDPQVNLKYLERTDKNVQRLITLVKDLDTISKLETGKIKPDYSVFDIYDVVKEVFEILEVKALEYGVRLRTNVQKGYYVKADREKIMEVIHNLVLNSIIYGKKDGETFVSISEKDEKIVVEVVDNGIGIDKKHLKHIFERFYRVDKSRSRERGGSGLGLSIVKHIIDSHNEILSVKSELGVGTSFSFTLQKEKTKH